MKAQPNNEYHILDTLALGTRNLSECGYGGRHSTSHLQDANNKHGMYMDMCMHECALFETPNVIEMQTKHKIHKYKGSQQDMVLFDMEKRKLDNMN